MINEQSDHQIITDWEHSLTHKCSLALKLSQFIYGNGLFLILGGNVFLLLFIYFII